MEFRDFYLKSKGPDESGSFTGIASPYGEPADSYGDVIQAGAYSRSISQQGAGLPLLWAHKQDTPVGLARLEDSRAGLVVNGNLLLSDSNGMRAYEHLKMGSVRGLSIGYSTPKDPAKVVRQADGTRLLREVFLHEVSLVAIPAAGRAVVSSVKTLGDVRDLMRGIKADDVTGEFADDIEAIGRELKRLAVHRTTANDFADVLAALQKASQDIARVVA
jgi:HK97 family phage prohead protease